MGGLRGIVGADLDDFVEGSILGIGGCGEDGEALGAVVDGVEVVIGGCQGEDGSYSREGGEYVGDNLVG